MSAIRLIQIGAGGFGQSWLKVATEHPNVELVAVADIMEDNLRLAGELTSLPPERLFTSPELALSQAAADMALIVTPPQTHKELAVTAMQAGLHVLMEKPLAHTYSEALELLTLSKGHNMKLGISQNYRWRPPVQTVKRLLDEQAIGKIGYVEYEFRKAMKFGGWRDNYKEILLEDMSIHHFDIMRFLLGADPVDVMAHSFRPDWSWFSGKPSASAVIRFEQDVHVHYFGSWVSRGQETTWNGDIRIVGDRGAIEMIGDEVKLWLGEAPHQAVCQDIELIVMPCDDRASSLDNFVAAVVGGTEPATSIGDNIRSFELTCAAIRSAQTGQRINISEFRQRTEAENATVRSVRHTVE
ncbi:Gfo/Idh/MocA family protein [Paenibacillus xerothermodurans]|uniref:Gfo/Idh/MocA family protein n=1 Tax=Paenibacillus xerothermodurans TaxID=1977292 RepID=UPI0014024CD8|nr:Gfo/Idh/MocA family oxidoreductase [Paenibacillus xerothermodurans]